MKIKIHVEMKSTGPQLSKTFKNFKIERVNRKLQLPRTAPGGCPWDLTGGCGPPLRKRELKDTMWKKTSMWKI